MADIADALLRPSEIPLTTLVFVFSAQLPYTWGKGSYLQLSLEDFPCMFEDSGAGDSWELYQLPISWTMTNI